MMDQYDAARAERDRKREALKTTAVEARNRLRPTALVKTGLEEVKIRAKAKPGAVASIAALAATMLFRKPIFNVLKRVLQEKLK
jgi:hypothetical protein